MDRFRARLPPVFSRMMNCSLLPISLHSLRNPITFAHHYTNITPASADFFLIRPNLSLSLSLISNWGEKNSRKAGK